MHRASYLSSSPRTGRIISVSLRREPPLSRGGASLATSRERVVTASSEILGTKAEEKITMPEWRSEAGALRGMSQEERRGAVADQHGTKRRPVLLVDVMGTIVRDPFHVDMPAFFGLTFKELLAFKHPTAWIEFEKGLLTEDDFALMFFNDKRDYDYEGLKQCMANGYEYLEGMETLLQRLNAAGADMHIFSNYPTWYSMIEDKLHLSRYLPWTFVSCQTGQRKPSQEAFLDAAEWLGVQPSDCIFIDDQLRNIEAASHSGMTGILFQNAQLLEKELAASGVSLEPLITTQNTL